MGKLKQLTEDEAVDRLDWLWAHAGPELSRTVTQAIFAGPPDGRVHLDAKAVEKLHEISRVAREVANYYTNREPRVTWEIGEEG